MKKILMAEYLEYNSDFKVGNHHYAKMFAETGYEVLWLSPVYNHITKIMNKKIYNQRKQLNKQSFIKLEQNIYGYSPYSLTLYGKLPILDTKFANKMSIGLTIPSLNKSLSRNNFDKVDILWLTNAKYYYLTKIIKYNKLVYRCADDVSAFKETCKSMPYFEEKIIKAADIVFVTSQDLIEKKQKIRSELIYLPNGVELSNFAREQYNVPAEYNNNGNKCVYVGAIDHWFDVELVRECADILNDIDFYLIGPVKIDLRALKSYKNVHILGKRDYKEIPNYLYYSDVSMIPFEVSTLTDSIAPIKLYEYMSVGLNVVSTKFKEINHINKSVYVAQNCNQFCEYIVQAIKNKDKDREKNIRFAEENTWQKRFEEIQKYVQEH